MSPPPLKPFEELPIPRKELAQALAGRYRVYENEQSFKTVEAENARQAIEASGIAQVHKVERDGIHIHTILDIQALASTPADAVAPPDNSPPASPASDTAQPPPA